MTESGLGPEVALNVALPVFVQESGKIEIVPVPVKTNETAEPTDSVHGAL